MTQANLKTQSWYFPTADSAWELIDPEAAGWDKKALEKAINFAGACRSTGVVILHRGRIMAERYWSYGEKTAEEPEEPSEAIFKIMQCGFDSHGRPIEDVASVQKSFTAVLACLARQKGYLSFDNSITEHLGKGWSEAPPEAEEKITIRHLMSMTSGLDDKLTFQAPPGKKWLYNTQVYQHLIRVIAAASGKNYQTLTSKWLSDLIGLENTAWIERKWAPKMGRVKMLGLAATARDLARFGLFVMAGGKWGPTEIVTDRKCLLEILRPSQQLNPSYGYLWWLNGQKRFMALSQEEPSEGPLVASAPPDLVAGFGALDRKLYIVPSLELVISRLGNRATSTVQGTRSSFDNDWWKLLSAAAPKV